MSGKLRASPQYRFGLWITPLLGRYILRCHGTPMIAHEYISRPIP